MNSWHHVLCVWCPNSAQYTCMWTQVWAARLPLCRLPEIFLLGSPSGWSLWLTQERRALNAASCGHRGSWFLPSFSAWSSRDKQDGLRISVEGFPNDYFQQNVYSQPQALTCRRCVYLQGWHWWSQQVSYLRTLSLHNATVVTSQVDAEPWGGGDMLIQRRQLNSVCTPMYYLKTW